MRALGLAAVLLALATPAAHARSWSAPEPVNDSGADLGAPTITADAPGDVIATWSGGPFGTRPQAAIGPVGAGWEPTAELFPGPVVESVDVALNARGDAVAAWTDPDGSVLATIRTSTTSWQPVTRIAGTGNPVSFLGERTVRVFIDEKGRATVAWVYAAGAFASQRSAATAWSVPQGLSGGRSGSHIGLTGNARGDVLVSWIGTGIDTARKLASGGWQIRRAVTSQGLGGSTPVAAMRPDGTAVLVWSQGELNDGSTSVKGTTASTTLSRAGDWQPGTVLPTTIRAPQIAVDGQGVVTAGGIGRDPRPVKFEISRGTAALVTTLAPGGKWTKPVTFSPQFETVTQTALSVGRSGDAAFVWRQGPDGPLVIKVVTRPGGGRWSAPVMLSRVGHEVGNPAVAADARGGAVALWVDVTTRDIQSSRLGPRTPRVTKLRVSSRRRVSYDVDLSTTVRFTLQRRRGSRYVTVPGGQTRSAMAGVNRFTLRRPAAGAYRLRATPAGGKTRSVRFTVRGTRGGASRRTR